MKRAGDQTRSFLLALLSRPERDAATLLAQDVAGEHLERLDTTGEVLSEGFRAALELAAERGHGTARRTVYTPAEERRRDTLRDLAARVKDGSATATDVRIGLRLVGKAIRATTAPVDKHALNIGIALLLSGAVGGPDAVPEYLRINIDQSDQEDSDHV